jgi:hypothetical protein
VNECVRACVWHIYIYRIVVRTVWPCCALEQVWREVVDGPIILVVLWSCCGARVFRVGKLYPVALDALTIFTHRLHYLNCGDSGVSTYVCVFVRWVCVCVCVAVAQMVQATRQNLDSIAVAMQGKMLEIQARQQGQRHREQQEAGDGAATSA